MAADTPRQTVQQTRPALDTVLVAPLKRPYPGVRNVPARTIQRALKKFFNDRAAATKA
jgi:hypothetical protein